MAPSGEVGQAFVLPVDPDDTVVCGAWHDDAVHVETALGERFRIRGGRVEPSTDAVPSPAPVTETVVGTHRFTWTDDGWLLAYSEASKVR